MRFYLLRICSCTLFYFYLSRVSSFSFFLTSLLTRLIAVAPQTLSPLATPIAPRQCGQPSPTTPSSSAQAPTSSSTIAQRYGCSVLFPFLFVFFILYIWLDTDMHFHLFYIAFRPLSPVSHFSSTSAHTTKHVRMPRNLSTTSPKITTCLPRSTLPPTTTLTTTTTIITRTPP
jgi:hypothetical protein